MVPICKARGRPFQVGFVVVSNQKKEKDPTLQFWLLVRKASLWKPLSLSLSHQYFAVLTTTTYFNQFPNYYFATPTKYQIGGLQAGYP